MKPTETYAREIIGHFIAGKTKRSRGQIERVLPAVVAALTAFQAKHCLPPQTMPTAFESLEIHEVPGSDPCTHAYDVRTLQGINVATCPTARDARCVLAGAQALKALRRILPLVDNGDAPDSEFARDELASVKLARQAIAFADDFT